MKIKKLTCALTLSIAVIIFYAIYETSKPTEELFYNYLSGDALAQTHVARWGIEYIPLRRLQKKSLMHGGSLIISAINISEAVALYDEQALFELIDLLISKGERVELLQHEPCGFFDQLIMKGDLNLIKHLTSQGAVIPSLSNKTCPIDLSLVLLEYKNRYSNSEYLKLSALLNEANSK